MKLGYVKMTSKNEIELADFLQEALQDYVLGNLDDEQKIAIEELISSSGFKDCGKTLDYTYPFFNDDGTLKKFGSAKLKN